MMPATATTLSTTPAPGRRAARKPASWVVLKAATGLLFGLATCQTLAAPVVIDSTGAVIDRAGVVRSPGGFSVIVTDSAGSDAVMARLAAVTAKLPGLTVQLSDDARQTVWEKCVTPASLSGATALLRSRMGAILAHPETRAFQRQLIDETLAVAQAEGVVLRPGLADEVMAKLALVPPSSRESMAEDLERVSRHKLSWLSGRVHALGLAHGMAAPAHVEVFRGLVPHEHGRAV